MVRPLPVSLAVLTTLALPASAVAPESALPPGASTLHDRLPVGPPEPVLDRTPSTQLRLARNPRLRALAARWGHAWAWRFDEATGRPWSAALPGVPLLEADALVDDVVRTLTADAGRPITLSEPTTHRRGERFVRTWTQLHDGLPLHGTELALFALSGGIQSVRTALVDPPTEPAPPGATLWWPDRGPDGKVRWRPARRTEADDIVTITHVDGTVLYRWTTRRHATVELQHDERRPGDPVIESPLEDGAIDDGTGVTYTDFAGVHSASDPYSLAMDGEQLFVRDYSRSGAPIPTVEGLEGDVLIEADSDVTWAAADTWHHTKVVETWLEDREPDHAILDIRVRANVNIGSFRCNAFYTSGTINFAQYRRPCANTGRLADVIYHEYGHGVHHYGLLAGGFAGDLSEGTADYISATILDDPRIGLGFYGDSRSLRDVSVDRVYPDDFRRQVHNDGRIWGSFLWNLREQWKQDYGEETGAEMVDQLMLDAMAQGPFMTTVGDAVILADDDDGDLSNGTPHACELADLLDQHGIGPGPIGVVQIEHDPVERVGSLEPGYVLDFGVYDAMMECSGLDHDSIALWWTTDPVTAEDAADPFLEGEGEEATAVTGPTFTTAGGATWSRLETTSVDGDFTGTIPRQLATTVVHYFIEARSQDGTERVTTHDGRLGDVYHFRVGDMEAVWCEDFEDLDAPLDPAAGDGGGDTDDTDLPLEHGGWEASIGTPWDEPADSADFVNQWQIGAPGEGLWSPEGAFSGEKVVATNLEGTYRNLNQQYLRSPALAVPEDGRAVVLSFRRWLSVEDAKYDKARIYVDDEQIWQQGGTSGGRDHTLDSRWTLFEIDGEALRGQDVRLTWTLTSDPGLEFGGWALDDVCVERLADVPGLHRPRDFALSVDEDDVVSAAWTQPWIAPLDEVIVVRKRGGLPTGRDDGLWVHQADAPEPGTLGTAVDTETEPCTTYGYAVFLRGDGVWYDAVVEGENAATITTSCAEPPGRELPDPVDPSVDGEVGAVDGYTLPPIEGCGCRSGAQGGLSWLALLGLVLLARRRRD